MQAVFMLFVQAFTGLDIRCHQTEPQTSCHWHIRCVSNRRWRYRTVRVTVPSMSELDVMPSRAGSATSIGITTLHQNGNQAKRFQYHPGEHGHVINSFWKRRQWKETTIPSISLGPKCDQRPRQHLPSMLYTSVFVYQETWLNIRSISDSSQAVPAYQHAEICWRQSRQ